MCVCVCVCVCVYMCVHVCTCVYMCVHVCVHACVCVCVYWSHRCDWMRGGRGAGCVCCASYHECAGTVVLDWGAMVMMDSGIRLGRHGDDGQFVEHYCLVPSNLLRALYAFREDGGKNASL